MLLAKVFSYLDGWHYLAKKYKKKSEFKGVRYKWCYAKLGIINHRGSFTRGINNLELLLSANIFLKNRTF